MACVVIKLSGHLQLRRLLNWNMEWSAEWISAADPHLSFRKSPGQGTDLLGFPLFRSSGVMVPAVLPRSHPSVSVHHHAVSDLTPRDLRV